MTADTGRLRAALPGYDLGSEVGRGGCGVVLSGVQRRLGRTVAIKQIPSQFAHDPTVRRRFVAEARVMAAIDHPHVVRVFDYVEHEQLCLLIMEYLPGGTVAHRFATQGFDAATAVAVALSCAAGLQAAHNHGVLHRDVKPSNLMFGAGGAIKLTDFGIAKIVGGDETLVTKAGEIIGTPSYIAPEQVRGEELSPATDIYSLATMLYQLLAGALPFPPAANHLATLYAHAYEQPIPLSEAAPRVPEPIASVVMRGLATDPTQRFGSAEEFGIALAAPAAHCWGSGWLAPVGIPVIGADTIVAAATGGSRHTTGGYAPSPPTVPMPATRTIGHTPAPTRHATRPSPPPPTARMRPQGEVQVRGARLIDLDRADLVPIREVVNIASPRVPFAVAAVLALGACAVALVGLGGPDAGGDLTPGTVTLANADPATGPVDLDLSAPVPLRVDGVDADAARLSIVLLGTRIGGTTTPIEPGSPTTVPAPVNPYIVAGTGTAELTLLRGETAVATQRVEFRTAQSALTTAAAVGIALLALLSLAYLESNLRALRRGRGAFANSAGLTVSAAATAVAVAGAAWVLLGTQPTVPALVVAALLGAAAGAASASGARRMGKRYRHLRGSRRVVAIVRE
ncbi:serine/threonine-protein kinase [Nocardia asteroides]|uniref:serine/threonine-protein kinase n=1 Tax=Nocardia asteroides TaxID=1824 RepID=UPI001E57EA1B|nr:serine/threonine-protein kinase [Nocardia asteroides]UGT62294.1 serine/threonine protein kinase [Nocardia asteroides]